MAVQKYKNMLMHLSFTVGTQVGIHETVIYRRVIEMFHNTLKIFIKVFQTSAFEFKYLIG